MVRVKSQSEIQAAYAASGGRASTNYRTGVAATTDWQSKATSDQAEANYADGVGQAISAKSRQKGLARVSNADWQSQAQAVGAGRLSTGISANATKQAQRFEPHRAALSGLTLPAKTRDASSNIDNRMKPIALLLEAKKKEIKGVS